MTETKKKVSCFFRSKKSWSKRRKNSRIFVSL